jgi:hypothetical protein
MKLATAILVASLGISAPAAAETLSIEKPIQLAQAEFRFSIGNQRPRFRDRIIVREDRGLHRGWRHSRHWGEGRRVVRQDDAWRSSRGWGRRTIVRDDDGFRRRRTTTIVRQNGPFVQKRVIMQQD